MTLTYGPMAIYCGFCGSMAQWLGHLEFELGDPHIASAVSQLQEAGVQKGSFRRLSGYGD